MAQQMTSQGEQNSKVPMGKWDHEADVVVVGTGAAGSSAALFAHERGARVIMVEKAKRYGGTTEKSGGGFWTPNNSFMAAAGIEDPREDAIQYMARLAYPTLYSPKAPWFGLSEHQHSLIAAFYDSAAAAVNGLKAMGALEPAPWLAWDGQFFPDYFAHLPENKAPRGRGLGPKDPETGKVLMSGFELIRQLRTAVQAREIPVLLNHRAHQLITNGKGEVIGLEALRDGKEIVRLRARKGVTFASGGFTHNPEMRLNYLRGPVYGGCAVPTNQGDFIPIASMLGAKLANLANAWWAEAVLEEVLQNPSPPTDVFIVPGDSMIQVNKYGKRVMDEKFVYNERAQTHFVWDPVRGEYPNLFLFMIYDQRSADIWGANHGGWGYPIPQSGTSAPHVITGQTWEELTRAIEARLASLADRTGNFRLDPSFLPSLKEAIARFNQYAETGVDLEFHRGEPPVDLAFFGPKAAGNNKPNATMFPLSASGPYYAVILAGGTLDTKGGPKIDAKAQVLDREDRPIPGLYGAGNAIGSPAGQAYWAGGGTIGPALTFGYIAGTNAAAGPVKEEG